MEPIPKCLSRNIHPSGTSEVSIQRHSRIKPPAFGHQSHGAVFSCRCRLRMTILWSPSNSPSIQVLLPQSMNYTQANILEICHVTLSLATQQPSNCRGGFIVKHMPSRHCFWFRIMKLHTNQFKKSSIVHQYSIFQNLIQLSYTNFHLILGVDVGENAFHERFEHSRVDNYQ